MAWCPTSSYYRSTNLSWHELRTYLNKNMQVVALKKKDHLEIWKAYLPK